MASVIKRHIFKDGKVMYEDRIAYANGEFISLDDFDTEIQSRNNKIAQLQCELDKTYNQLMEVEKEAQEHIAELETELEVKDNLLKIKNGLCGNDEMKDKESIEIAMDIIKGRNIDDLEQIAQHIQVYCRHTRSRRDDTIAF